MNYLLDILKGDYKHLVDFYDIIISTDFNSQDLMQECKESDVMLPVDMSNYINNYYSLNISPIQYGVIRDFLSIFILYEDSLCVHNWVSDRRRWIPSERQPKEVKVLTHHPLNFWNYKRILPKCNYRLVGYSAACDTHLYLGNMIRLEIETDCEYLINTTIVNVHKGNNFEPLDELETLVSIRNIYSVDSSLMYECMQNIDWNSNIVKQFKAYCSKEEIYILDIIMKEVLNQI